MLFRATILFTVLGLAANQAIGAAIEAPRDVAAVLIATSPCPSLPITPTSYPQLTHGYRLRLQLPQQLQLQGRHGLQVQSRA